jgi:hypothetical protein
MAHPGVVSVLQVIGSDRFKKEVQALGGYDTRDTGKARM